MAVIPYSRVVDVSVSRNDAFPSRRGFGTQLIITTETVAGKVDTTARTKAYGSMEEVATDWAPTTSAYKAALSAFSQNPRPRLLKIGHVADDGTMTGPELTAQLDLLYAYDSDWYFLTIAANLRDVAALSALLTWIQAKPKLAIIDSNDDDTENPAATTSIAAANKGDFDRAGVFYHTTADVYPAASLAAYMQTRSFDEANTAYTAKFKYLPGIPAVNIGSAALTAVTGFTPGVGQSEAAGHMANTYIDIGSRNFVVEGSTLTANVFLDEIHATDWIIARTEEEMLGIFLNNPRVRFDDSGMQVLAGAVRTVMQQAIRAGIVANDLNPETGDYEAAVQITVPSVFDVPESQRKARIAPNIECRFRYAGAVHYAVVRYQMAF
ncbi:DUF3383 family protein [Shinella sp. AETb1-6]|uniref:DUF3383 family protein n=1 Tax=Shinella TaxID=323620 RepID=UPI00106E6FE9|nr:MULTISPECIES: DUF3383 family protein [Shinella]MCD1264542.1 DUF3383 family protein [Shinella sumterensis]MXN51912.1 DUF3383 family protein [Shinella sp. AETb1-6]TFE94093.1 hypothetical protein B5M44_24040 [Shinella sumterensis]